LTDVWFYDSIHLQDVYLNVLATYLASYGTVYLYKGNKTT